MSKENAKRFYDDIVIKGEQDIWFGKSSAQIQEIIEKDTLNFTIDEIKKVIRDSVISQKISDAELDIAAGGRDRSSCQVNFWDRDCTDTVENGSHCGSGDFCVIWDSVYYCSGPAKACDQGYDEG